MSKISILNDKFEKTKDIELPQRYADINPHNLYLYVKSYLAAIRSNTANTKGRSDVSGGGKKPWRQKGRGGARAGSTRTNVWVGGAVAFGPKNTRNYFQKINKKQKRLALEYSIEQKAAESKIFVFDNLNIESGKTKDAAVFINRLNVRDALIVKENLDSNTHLAYRNLSNCYLVDATEVNAYLISVFSAVIIEKSALEFIVKED